MPNDDDWTTTAEFFTLEISQDVCCEAKIYFERTQSCPDLKTKHKPSSLTSTNIHKPSTEKKIIIRVYMSHKQVKPFAPYLVQKLHFDSPL